jgi:hemerythrin-like domain-containing protein
VPCTLLESFRKFPEKGFFMRTEKYALQELRMSLDSDSDDTPKFVTLLEKHHDYLQDCIAVLSKPDALETDKQISLQRFLHILVMHAKAEEETLYTALITADEKNLRIEGLGGQDEHDIADQLGNELRQMGFESHWSDEIDAKAKTLAGLVGNHLKHEESVVFALAKHHFDADTMLLLSKVYLDKCKNYLDEELSLDTDFTSRFSSSQSMNW